MVFRYHADFTEAPSLSWTQGEGWGLTHNHTHIIVSTGSSSLFICDEDLTILQELPIVDENGNPLLYINELEWVKTRGEQFVYANVWQTADIVKISLAERKVVGRVNEDKMLADSATYEHGDEQETLNGLAFNIQRRLFLQTGKKWPRYYVTPLDLKH